MKNKDKNGKSKSDKKRMPPKLKAPTNVVHYELKVSELKDFFKLTLHPGKVEIHFEHAAISLPIREASLLGEALSQITSF